MAGNLVNIGKIWRGGHVLTKSGSYGRTSSQPEKARNVPQLFEFQEQNHSDEARPEGYGYAA